MADDGRALLDYGFLSWDHMAADLRFVEHSLDDLKAVAGLRAVDVVIPSHYHDDHLAGLPWLQQTQGTKAWIFENFAEIVSNPAGYNVPCLLPHPIRVDRALTDGGRVSWDRWTFDVFHMPGHTWWALGLFGVIDGTRVAFTGDNLLQGTVSPLRAAAPVYRNKMLADSIAVGVRRLMDFEPELILTGHTGALRVDRKMLEDFHGWARQIEGVFKTLVAVPAEVNFALDPNFATLYPYQNRARAGDRLSLELRVTNHGTSEAAAHASLVAPPGWSVAPGEVTLPIAAGETDTLRFRGRGRTGRRGRQVIRRAVPRRTAIRSGHRGAGRRGLSASVARDRVTPTSQQLDVRLGRLPAVDGQHVLGTGRERHDRIHLRLEDHVLSRLRHRGQVLDALARHVLRVLEQVERARRLRRREADRAHRVPQVLRAVVVVLLRAELLVPIDVAGRDQGVVDARRRVLDQRDDRAAPVRHHGVADDRRELVDGDAAVLHRHELLDVAGVERPVVDDLRAVRVDHLVALALADAQRQALARGNRMPFRHGPSPLTG
jgi:glyoxylase-like metal-dependent hydrolase (beta-lactamase superfamily II)